ncbi:MAG: DUF4013 domain-containing protein [Anaerolineales bacterium]|nr:DUF4013 domain-containing protein [Anaerolineales bacterium]
MNIGKSFSFVFDDPKWVGKLGLGALISFIPILNLSWTGYMVGIIRNVMNGSPEPLPTWDDLGKKFMDGLLLTVGGLVYALPIIIVFCLPLSFMIIPAILAGNSDLQDIASAIAGLGSALFFCLLCVFILYALALSVVYPAILVVFAREGTLASCFKFREIFGLISQNSSAFITAWAVNLGLSFAVSFIVGIAQTALNLIPCLGQIAAVVVTFGVVMYATAVYAHLFGQFGYAAGQSESITPA